MNGQRSTDHTYLYPERVKGITEIGSREGKAWSLVTQCSGTASIYLLMGEKDPQPTTIGSENTLNSKRSGIPTGSRITTSLPYHTLCAAVLKAFANLAKSLSSLRNWCILEGISLAQQMGMAYALITGANVDRAVTRATGNRGTLPIP